MTGTDRPGAEWDDPERVAAYSSRETPHRREGEAALVELLPHRRGLRVLDLGTGDGRLLRVVGAQVPLDVAVGVDSSPEMLGRAHSTDGNGEAWRFEQHDLSLPLAVDGPFDVVVSGLAIHHLTDARKRSLFREAREMLAPGGLFANLDLVKLPTDRLEQEFLAAIGRHDGGDPSDQPATVTEQLRWLEEAGFVDVDCYWKWRGIALLAGRVPGPASDRS